MESSSTSRVFRQTMLHRHDDFLPSGKRLIRLGPMAEWRLYKIAHRATRCHFSTSRDHQEKPRQRGHSRGVPRRFGTRTHHSVRCQSAFPRDRQYPKQSDLSRYFKGIPLARIRQFESYMPSQAVHLRRVDRTGAVAPAQPKSGLRQRAKAGSLPMRVCREYFRWVLPLKAQA
jgi:hypothetical protein